MARDCRGEVGEGWVSWRRARFERVERAFVTVERREARLGRQRPLVCEVVRRAGEAINRADGRAQGPGHDERGDGKVFVMSDGHAKSGAVRRNVYISLEKGRPRRGVFLASRTWTRYNHPFGESGCESGGIGRRTGFRFQRGSPWGFESPLSHHRFTLARIRRACKPVSKPSANSSAG